MNSPEIALKTILKEIRLYENGPAVDGMKRLGLNYHKNFGVSLIHLKEIAKKYYPNHQLAELLRTKNFRETLILSFMIDNPEEISDTELNYVFEKINNQELAEQLVLNILEKNDIFHDKAFELIHKKNKFLISAGFILYSRIALTEKDKKDIFFENFFEKALELSDREEIYIRKSIARAFRQTALRNDNLKRKVLNSMEKIKDKNSNNADLIYEEVVPLLNF